MKKIKYNKYGFTLVELLAVIVILAIILVIAVPKVMSVIEDAKKATLESTAKMIVSAAEKAKVQNTVLGKDEKIQCEDVVKLNEVDYEFCDIKFEGNTAKVTITGSGKFAGLYVCNGDKTSATATTEECKISAVYSPTFADNSWAEIAAACQNNEVPETWMIGDTKEMVIGEKTFDIRIIGKNHDAYADGSGTAPLTFQTVDNVVLHNMNTTDTVDGSWFSSAMREYLNSEAGLISMLEDDVKNNIKSVYKYTNKGYVGNEKPTDIVISSDKLFLLSIVEFDISILENNDIYTQEGVTYDYYKTLVEPPYKYFDGNGDEPIPWWTRSPYARDDSFYLVIFLGFNHYVATTEAGVSFAFCF